MTAMAPVTYVCPECDKKEIKLEGGYSSEIHLSNPRCKECNVEMRRDDFAVVKSMFKWIKDKL